MEARRGHPRRTQAFQGVRKPGGRERKGGCCGKTPPPIRSRQRRELGRHPAPPPSMNRRYVPKGVLPVTS